MTCTDAKEYLHIAKNAYELEAFTEALEILYKVAHWVAYDDEMTESIRQEIINETKSQLSRFQFCPDEACWEESCGIYDLFRD